MENHFEKDNIMRTTKFYEYVLLIAGNGLLNSIKKHKFLLKEVQTINLYRTVTGYDPIIGAIIYMNQKEKDEIHNVISFISEYSKSSRDSYQIIETLSGEITDEWSSTFFNSAIGFLEERIKKMKEEVDTSSKNSWEKFWEHFDFTETEINCIELIYAMTIIDDFRDTFDNLLDFLEDNDCDEEDDDENHDDYDDDDDDDENHDDYDEDDDDDDEDDEEHARALTETISIMLDTNVESVSKILEGELVWDCIIDPKRFTLYDGISNLLDHRG
jgi:hypothetical protein